MQRSTPKPTMNDVARVADVATVTVSRVLNGASHVSAETAARVYRAINKLGYRPNEMARALRGLKSRTIGVIVPYLYDPFFAACAHAVNSVAREHKYSVILATSQENAEIEHEEAQLMLQRHVEGLVVVPVSSGPSKLSRPDFEKTHMVMLDRPVTDPRFDSVVVQNQSGTKRAIEHLVQVHGHKRIAYFGLGRHIYTIHARFEGYRRAMQAAKLQSEPYFDCTTEATVRSIVGGLMAERHPPTAFFGSNTLTTRFLLQALNDLGMRVPQDVALIGFDDFELADLMQPALTVVRQPMQDLGRVAASMLFERLKRDELPEQGSRVMLPVELVVRRSCGCSPRSHRTAG